MSGPMHSRNRFRVFLFFLALFVALIPVVLLYSNGYRLGKDLTLKPTGGMYVFYPESEAQIYLNGVESDRTSLFERGVFIDNLDAETYFVEVWKKGYVTWKKNIEVKDRRVSEAYPFLIPEVVSTSSLPRFIKSASGSTVTNPLYAEVVQLFATSTASTSKEILKEMLSSTTTSLVSTSTAIVNKDMEIDIEGKKIMAYWKGREDATPFYLCDIGRSACQDSLVVAEGDFKRVDFYPGRNDVILYSTKEGIFATELDNRSPQNTFKLLSGNLDFREEDQRVFVKQGSMYYELLFTASTTINSISI